MSVLFTQTKEYLKWHESVGRKVFVYEGKNGDGVNAYGIVVKSNFGNILYFPFGPNISEDLPKAKWSGFLAEVRSFAAKENCFFVRFESLGDKNFGKNFYRPNMKYFLNDGYLQPRVEWWLDITKREEDIYNNFSKNHRYSVRRAEKDGVEIEIVESNFEKKGQDESGRSYEKVFLDLMNETAGRDGFLMQDEKYLKAVLKSIEEGNIGKSEFVGFLAFSKIDRKYNGVAVVLVYRDVANFIYGGSTEYKRESGATVKLQFECIKKAKKWNARSYNFGGIYKEGLSKKSLENLTKYKKQYGGYEKLHGFFVDLPINKLKYYIYITKKYFNL